MAKRSRARARKSTRREAAEAEAKRIVAAAKRKAAKILRDARKKTSRGGPGTRKGAKPARKRTPGVSRSPARAPKPARKPKRPAAPAHRRKFTRERKPAKPSKKAARAPAPKRRRAPPVAKRTYDRKSGRWRGPSGLFAPAPSPSAALRDKQGRAVDARGKVVPLRAVGQVPGKRRPPAKRPGRPRTVTVWEPTELEVLPSGEVVPARELPEPPPFVRERELRFEEVKPLPRPEPVPEIYLPEDRPLVSTEAKAMPGAEWTSEYRPELTKDQFSWFSHLNRANFRFVEEVFREAFRGHVDKSPFEMHDVAIHNFRVVFDGMGNTFSDNVVRSVADIFADHGFEAGITVYTTGPGQQALHIDLSTSEAVNSYRDVEDRLQDVKMALNDVHDLLDYHFDGDVFWTVGWDTDEDLYEEVA